MAFILDGDIFIAFIFHGMTGNTVFQAVFFGPEFPDAWFHHVCDQAPAYAICASIWDRHRICARQLPLEVLASMAG